MNEGSRRRWWRVTVLGLGIVAIHGWIPVPAHASPSTCNGAFQLLYTAGANFPQPVPPGTASDDTLSVQLVLGAGAINNGTKLTVNDVRFDLDCSSGAGSPTPC